MIGWNFAAIDGQAESSGADIENSGSDCYVDPELLLVGYIAGDAMVAAQGSYSLAGPATATSSEGRRSSVCTPPFQ